MPASSRLNNCIKFGVDGSGKNQHSGKEEEWSIRKSLILYNRRNGIAANESHHAIMWGFEHEVGNGFNGARGVLWVGNC